METDTKLWISIGFVIVLLVVSIVLAVKSDNREDAECAAMRCSEGRIPLRVQTDTAAVYAGKHVGVIPIAEKTCLCVEIPRP